MSRAPITITTSEILAALRTVASTNDPGEGVTSSEIAAAMGWSGKATVRHLAALKARGELVVTRVRRESLDGRFGQVPGYVLLKPTKKKKAA